ncbi:MAG TPA: hypothetical protein VMY59_08260 [Candidatus Thermoplasmatota archaeon]|nr:hypothetical protein [Candidatus Thermoplasmatota archaeon]
MGKIFWRPDGGRCRFCTTRPTFEKPGITFKKKADGTIYTECNNCHKKLKFLELSPGNPYKPMIPMDGDD